MDTSPASTARTAEQLRHRPDGGFGLDPATVLTSIGIFCVILGGLVSAVTAPLELAHGSWAAAYLVLVGGVAQYAMGHSRTRHPDVAQSQSWAWTQIGAWNLGNVAVIGGTQAGQPWLVDLGSGFLVAALVIALQATRRSPAMSARPAAQLGAPWIDQGYRLVLLVMALSIPIGIVLAHVRHS